MDNYIYYIKSWSFKGKDEKIYYKMRFLTADDLEFHEQYINQQSFEKLQNLSKPLEMVSVVYHLNKEMKAYINDIVI